MLSETHKRRPKNSWSEYTLNPRGELWRKDETNFGNKLLKKMGWKAGEGLGKNKSGITKPIHLVETRNNEGLGFSKMTSDYSSNWLSNRDDFDSLLSQLREQHAVPSEVVSHKPGSTSSVENHGVPLAKRSKKSRKRVHYQRLVQGKDMSNRSQADWKCVLGGKRKRKDEEMEPNPEPEEGDNGTSSLLHTSTLSLQEYFVSKRLKCEPRETEMEEVEAQPVPELDANPTEVTQNDMDTTSLNRKKKKKKKRKNKKVLESGLCEESVLLEEKENSCQAEDSLIVLRKGKRKLKKGKNRGTIQTLFEVVESTHLLNVKSSQIVSSDVLDSSPLIAETMSDQQTEAGKKKRVRFRTLPAVCIIPRNDPIRGGAGFWMTKAKRKRMGFKIRN